GIIPCRWHLVRGPIRGCAPVAAFTVVPRNCGHHFLPNAQAATACPGTSRGQSLILFANAIARTARTVRSREGCRTLVATQEPRKREFATQFNRTLRHRSVTQTSML